MNKYFSLRKRGLALFVALMMCLSLLPGTALAAEEISEDSIPVVTLEITEPQNDESAGTDSITDSGEILGELVKEEVPEGYEDNGNGTYVETGVTPTITTETTSGDEEVDFDESDNATRTTTTTEEKSQQKHTPVYDEAGNLTGYKVVNSIVTTETTVVEDKKTELTNQVVEAPAEDAGVFSEDGATCTVIETTVDEETGIETTVVKTLVKATGEDGTETWTNTSTVTTTKTTTVATEMDDKRPIMYTLGYDKEGNTYFIVTTSDNSILKAGSIVPDIVNPNGEDKTGLVMTSGGKKWYVNYYDPKIDLENLDGHIFTAAGFFAASPIFINKAGNEDKDHQPVGLNPVYDPGDVAEAGIRVLLDADGNLHYVYCADLSTIAVAGTSYDIENLEDAQYLDSESYAKLQAVALNGYWGTAEGFGSLELLKESMEQAQKDGLIGSANLNVWLSPGAAIAGTQAAIWAITNGSEGINTDDPFSTWWYASGNYAKPNTAGPNSAYGWTEKLAKLVYDYLINVVAAQAAEHPEEASASTDVIRNEDLHDIKVSVKELSQAADIENELPATYNTDVSFVLEVERERIFSKDMTVNIYSPDDPDTPLGSYLLLDNEKEDGKQYAEYDAETNTYILRDIVLPNGISITLKLSGTQEIKENAYLITAESGWDSSQTFVGIEKGERDVNLTMNFDFTVQDVTVDPDPDPDPDPTPTPTPTPDPVIPDNPTPLSPAPDTGIDIEDQDVPLAAPGLNSVDHYAYIIGYTDGLVHPEANITRAEVATIFFRLMLDEFRMEHWATENSFSDVKTASWYNNGVSTSAKAGIVKGYTDGSFRPDRNITRAEFAAIAARFLSDEVNVGASFSDISGHWAEEEINRAVMAGWIKGYTDGAFRPDQPITRAEAVTMINRMLDRTPDKDHLLEDMIRWADNTEDKWYYADMQEATNSHDYERLEMILIEDWTELLDNRDWVQLEKEWSTASSAPGAEVADNLDLSNIGTNTDGADADGESTDSENA